MKLVTVFLLVTISICTYSDNLPDAVNKALPLAVDNILPFVDLLKLLLKTLGISCVNELGPEAAEVVKKLLVPIGCGLICQ
ncbi:unnamed protein product [Nyctereutes procyonoides]|uniref:(raccoon dog) hypothetical protein n=1 Tax=Nyctereutes procyonoides TaxID=34880 RepID=A0A811YR59_NYCPR|nr:unnamed protein product [Nyctereutes procyonoides]